MDGSRHDEDIKPGMLIVPEPEDHFRANGEHTDLTAVDFWSWNTGDLRMNTTRGFLAEFLVAQAVGDPVSRRQEWAAFDICAADGTRIELKASGYAQSWPGKDVDLTFEFETVHKTTGWDDNLGKDIEVDPEDRVHVWVFAVQETPRNAEVYDPMDLDKWSFRVVPHAWLRTCGQKSGGLSFFEKNGYRRVSYTELPQAVQSARKRHEEILRSKTR